MKKQLQFLFAFCLFVISGPGFQAMASHQAGSTITYLNVAPGTYLVSLHLYQDCTVSGIVEPTFVLSLQAPGCNTGRTVTLNQVGLVRQGNHYCASIPQVCNTTARPNYQNITYNGVVTFTAAEQACSDWMLSVTAVGNSRSTSENVATTSGMYNESFLKLDVGINNNSAQLNSMDDPVPVFCVGRQVQYIINATDPDCDSLSYELVAPLAAANTPVTYKPHTVVAGSMVINPNPKPPFSNPFNPQYAVIPNMGTLYTPAFPLQSFLVNWGTQPGTVSPFFKLDPQLGMLRFLPGYYDASPIVGFNRYFVTVQINEWRKVNGVVTKVGFIRRDLRFRIEDCGSNSLPGSMLLVPVQNPLPTPLNYDTLFTVQSGSLLNIQFQTLDLDSNDSITVATDVTTSLPGAQFSLSNAKQPIGTISWLAVPGACNGIRYFRVRISDNACPVKGKTEFLVGVRVISNANPTGITKAIKDLQFTALPNPFREEVSFKVNLPGKEESQILIYNLLGKEIDRILIPAQANEEQQVNWSGAGKFAAGSYIARLCTEGKTIQTLKFIKL